MTCYITLCKPNNQDEKIILEFDIFPTEIANRWRQQVLLAQSKDYKIDDPQRFYGMNNLAEDINIALIKINDNITAINNYQTIVERRLESINDQDTLNYLHHIFEVYHGPLDSQNTDFWINAPKETQQALAQLNINVHRIESIQRKNSPRFVVTYFQLPKTQKLQLDDYKYLTDCYDFGGLYLNYVEIGKTLEDLMKDDDQYILPESFKPWENFSADFRITLNNTNTIESRINREKCLCYYDTNKEFFESQGYSKYDTRLRPGFIHIGKMRYTNQEHIFNLIKEHQYVLEVNFV